MELLPVEIIQINKNKIVEIETIIKSIYRLIIYSRHHLDDDLLDIYLAGIHNLKELVGIKSTDGGSKRRRSSRIYAKFKSFA